jgi:hypothetical protein
LGELAEKSLPKPSPETQILKKQEPATRATRAKANSTSTQAKASSSIRFGTKNAAYQPALNDPRVVSALLGLNAEPSDSPDAKESKPAPTSEEFESARPSTVDAKLKERVADSFQIRAAATKILR